MVLERPGLWSRGGCRRNGLRILRAMDIAGLNQRLDGTRFADVRWFAEIDSTNRWLLDEARAGAPEGLVAVADHQSAGRGRRDRTWLSPPGSALLVSVLLRPALPADVVPLLTIAGGLAACEAVAQCRGARPGLKWPNDVVWADGEGGGAGAPRPERKLAGLLAEIDRSGAVVLGMGLNMTGAGIDPEVRGIAVALDELPGRPSTRDDLLVAWLRRLEARVSLLGVLGGPAELLANYRDVCVTIGRRVRVELAGREPVEGVAASIGADGRLVVAREIDGEADGVTVAVTAGDVVHLR
jgi:BirA family transcriptional regulator, biotin operon repressor / biotin---[acetyl-CoA-carboxylase] ligase